jgi:dolichyl-phosphate-mannose-protein mannosyltransferase
VTRAAVGLAGAAMVLAAVVRYPPDPALSFDLALFTWPERAKLAAVFASCAGLAGLDLAAYAAGWTIHRWLRPHPPSTSRVVLLERMGLGLLALAYLALALAAARQLQRSMIVGVVLALALAGALLSARDLRGAARPSRENLLLASAAGLLLLGPFLGAWVPDYGWDGFSYHLAVPERYLYRGRIVVTPLFPHSAFPHTVEMLYLFALSLDSGALAKLLHLQFGALAAAAVFATAGAASRRAGMLAVAILAADPLFNWELGVAYNDLAAAFFAVLAAAAAGEWRRERARPALRIAAVFAGACLGVRYPAGAVLLAVVAFLWLSVPWRDWADKARLTVEVVALAALVFSPWLVRNFVFTGNPMAPVLQSVFHRQGGEYFHPVALAQAVTFARSIGFGRGILDLLLLPVNATLRVEIGSYAAFGYRIGVMYVVGVLAFVFAGHRSPSAAGAALKLAGLLTLVWFYTFQEPRYLLPALCLIAVAGGVGLNCLITRGRHGAALWLIPLVALIHTQWSAARLLPYRYGYALGSLPLAAFEAQEPSLAVVPRLRQLMAPGDRLFLIYEPRGFFYRGLDYLASNSWEVMQMVHEAESPAAFAEQLAALGVTHVLVNTDNVKRYRTWFVEGYGAAEFERDLARLDAFVVQETTPLFSDRHVLVRRLGRGR